MRKKIIADAIVDCLIFYSHDFTHNVLKSIDGNAVVLQNNLH